MVKPTNMAEEWTGLSTDTKPATAYQGSIFVEVDTGDVYFYDADGAQWVKQFSFQE
jgi:hypothetical protein